MTKSKRQQAAEKFVREYFETFPLEVFEGLVTTTEVVMAVFLRLSDATHDPDPPDYDAGMIYDAIVFLGPVGEDDVKWLHKWGGDRIAWTEDDPMAARAYFDKGRQTHMDELMYQNDWLIQHEQTVDEKPAAYKTEVQSVLGEDWVRAWEKKHGVPFVTDELIGRRGH